MTPEQLRQRRRERLAEIRNKEAIGEILLVFDQAESRMSKTLLVGGAVVIMFVSLTVYLIG